jgi:hypothetical protein
MMAVSDTKAMGYVNNSKFLVDDSGTAYVAVRSRGEHGFNIALVHSVGAWGNGMSFEQTWLEDRPGLEVSTAPQRPAAIAFGADGSIHMVWYGGSAAAPEHQIRYARFATGAGAHIQEETAPFTVPGFPAAPGPGSNPEAILWQEHPSLAVGPDGSIHVAWEARDPTRTSNEGAPRPGVAYATRSRAGVWSVSGILGRPPYLGVDDPYPSQSRPTILVDRTGTVHVLCYGSVASVQQILHGEIKKNGNFSGWRPISPSPADQRHVAAALDPEGRVHAVWREGTLQEGAASAQVSIYYSALDPDGKWRKAIRVSAADENASTPSIAADQSRVSVAWVAWTPGAMNTEGQPDNGFPSDNSTVQGRLKVAWTRNEAGDFASAIVIDEGQASYPSWALRSPGGDNPPALIWSSIEPGGAKGGRVGLHLAWCAGYAH